MDDSQIRVFAVDAEELTRTGLRTVLDDEPDIELVGDAASIAEACARLPVSDPDVTVVDLDLPDGCGTHVCRFVREHRLRTRVIALTTYGDDAIVAHAVQAGADAVVTKRASTVELLDGIRRIAAGRALTDRHHRERIDALARSGNTDEQLSRLTHQERVLLGHLARGLTNREIACEMGLSDKTVKNYVSSIMMKLDVTHRAAAAAYFARAEAQLPCSTHEVVVGEGAVRY